VELTPAGKALLERARRALSEVELAVEETPRAGGASRGAASLGYGPFSRSLVRQIAGALEADGLRVQLEDGVAPELAGRVSRGELAASVAMAVPAAARRFGVRVDTLRDEPLLAALPRSHRFAREGAIPVTAFAAERVLVPRGEVGRAFNAWFRAVVRAAGAEIERTVEALSAPWDPRMLPVADGGAVSMFVAEWAAETSDGVAAVPFDPPLAFPVDLVSHGGSAGPIVRAALALRDAEGWLTHRTPRTELPGD
jgi:DNA-binding transcriptional LysR family regulator